MARFSLLTLRASPFGELAKQIVHLRQPDEHGLRASQISGLRISFSLLWGRSPLPRLCVPAFRRVCQVVMAISGGLPGMAEERTGVPVPWESGLRLL